MKLARFLLILMVVSAGCAFKPTHEHLSIFERRVLVVKDKPVEVYWVSSADGLWTLQYYVKGNRWYMETQGNAAEIRIGDEDKLEAFVKSLNVNK